MKTFFALSSRGDSRLAGEGGRKAWPWIRSVLLAVVGFFTVIISGVLLGMGLGFPPDETPQGIFIWLGIAVNLSAGLVLMLAKKKPHAYSFMFPAVMMLAVDIIRSFTA
jgi:hypothetical protein